MISFATSYLCEQGVSARRNVDGWQKWEFACRRSNHKSKKKSVKYIVIPLTNSFELFSSMFQVFNFFDALGFRRTFFFELMVPWTKTNWSNMLFFALVKHETRWNMSYYLMKVVFISNGAFWMSLKQFLLTFLKKIPMAKQISCYFDIVYCLKKIKSWFFLKLLIFFTIGSCWYF